MLIGGYEILKDNESGHTMKCDLSHTRMREHTHSFARSHPSHSVREVGKVGDDVKISLAGQSLEVFKVCECVVRGAGSTVRQ